jgi:hypothetical protein
MAVAIRLQAASGQGRISIRLAIYSMPSCLPLPSPADIELAAPQ